MDVERDTTGTHAHLVPTNSRHRCGDFCPVWHALLCQPVRPSHFVVLAPCAWTRSSNNTLPLHARASTRHHKLCINNSLVCWFFVDHALVWLAPWMSPFSLPSVCTACCVLSMCGSSASHGLALAQHKFTCLFHRSSVLVVDCCDHTAPMNTNTTASKARKCWCTPPRPCSHTQSY